jgi:hypothetical protein
MRRQRRDARVVRDSDRDSPAKLIGWRPLCPKQTADAPTAPADLPTACTSCSDARHASPRLMRYEAGMKRFGLAVWVGLIVVGGASCSTEGEPTHADVGNPLDGSSGIPGDGDSCPRVAMTCPAGCAGIDGWIVDREHACLDRRVRLGCRDEDVAGTADIGCVREVATGWLYQLASGSDASALAETAEYVACADEEQTMTVEATACDLRLPGEDTCPNDLDTCPEGCVPFEGREYNRDASCLEAPVQLGCFGEGIFPSPNGACAKEISTGKVFMLESGSYSDDLQFSGDYKACGLDDVAGSSTTLGDCP